MSARLNRNRQPASRLAGLAVVIAVACSHGMLVYGSVPYAAMVYVGYGLVVFCALGRIYATAFVGGFKNQVLITEGPFATIRNPLYFFSLIGIAGVGLTSGRISIFVLLVGMHLISYHFLIGREEAALDEKFHGAYAAYRTRVPRLLPRLALRHTPREVTLQIGPFYSAIRDGSVWFLAFPFFQLIHYLHTVSVLPAWFFLP
ncbi:MAG: methyltransferase family protein [Stellaceae bacterium]